MMTSLAVSGKPFGTAKSRSKGMPSNLNGGAFDVAVMYRFFQQHRLDLPKVFYTENAAKKKKILKAIKALFSDKGCDHCVLYYTGHGYDDNGKIGANFSLVL
jgi:hypothetical protein